MESAWMEEPPPLVLPPLPSPLPPPDNLFEVCGALPAGIDAGEQLHQLPCIGLLLSAGAVGQLRRQGVKEGPRGPEVRESVGKVWGESCAARECRRESPRGPAVGGSVGGKEEGAV